MLKDNDIEFEYREYTKDPLSVDEIKAVLKKLRMGPRDVLRARDAKKLDLEPGTMDDEQLIAAMAVNPRLLQRPIGVKGRRAVLGRPPENLLDLK